jgi:acyl-CoA thioesterase-1
MQCGATRPIRYCLALLGASLIALFGLACSPDDASGPGDLAPPGEAAAREVPEMQSGRAETTSAERDASTAAAERPVVAFLGTSLTAGYGLREDQAFPALIQGEIDAAGLEYRVINAGVSGDTSAGGLRRLDWLLRLPIAVLVLELGANDMLRGLNVEELERNLAEILDRTASSHPDSRFLIAGMRAAPNLGSDYRGAFDEIYPALAKQFDAKLVPFLLEDVAARRNLNQADGIHPTAEGHALIAMRVWEQLEPILRSN